MKYNIKKIFADLFLLIIFSCLFVSRPLLAIDLFEPNNTLEQAVPIFVSDPVFQAHEFISADDEDWMVFYAKVGTETLYDIRIPDDSVGINVDPVIEIYDISGNLLLHHDFGFEGEGERIASWRSLAEDFYYLRVYNKLKTEQAAGGQYEIHVFEPFAPFKTTIIGKIVDQCSGIDITTANIVTEVGKTRTHRTGDYGLPIFPGDYTLIASAREYNEESRAVTVEENKRFIADFQLMPDVGCTELSATYDEATGVVTLFDVLADGIHYLVELQDQGGLLFNISSIEPLSSGTLNAPALYDIEALKLTIPQLLAVGQVYSVTLVNTGNFLFAVESAQLIQ